MAGRFGCKEVTFVGDRGMIKSQQIESLPKGFHYITAITKPQIQSLIKEGLFQQELFDETVAEVSTDEGIRYVLRRNPIRADEIAGTRREKLSSVQRLVDGQNRYLTEHPRAQVPTALEKITKKLERLKISGWAEATAEGRTISLDEDEAALAEESQLDGCYVIKTDLDKDVASAETVHARYKDLAEVEQAFRTSKTAHLEFRPVHVRLATRTRGHVFVVMLAYRLVHELSRRWQSLDVKVQEGLDQLASLCSTTMLVKGKPRCQTIPEPREAVAELLSSAKIRLPEVLPSKGVKVATRKKLASRRKSR